MGAPQGPLTRVFHHGLGKWLVLQSFYDDLFPHLKQLLDTSAGIAFNNQSVKGATRIIDSLCLILDYSYQAYDTRRVKESEASQIALITSKVNTICNMVTKLTALHSPRANVVAHILCENCE